MRRINNSLLGQGTISLIDQKVMGEGFACRREATSLQTSTPRTKNDARSTVSQVQYRDMHECSTTTAGRDAVSLTLFALQVALGALRALHLRTVRNDLTELLPFL